LAKQIKKNVLYYFDSIGKSIFTMDICGVCGDDVGVRLDDGESYIVGDRFVCLNDCAYRVLCNFARNSRCFKPMFV
jgi:hypothetical protein